MNDGRAVLALVLPLAFLLASCGDGPDGPGPGIEGVWGADHVNLIADAQGLQVETDCAHGAAEELPVLDSAGEFVVAGTYTFEGGPVDVNDPPVDHPAVYRGRVQAGQMALTVTLTETDDVLGPYVLGHGVQGVLFKCY